IIPGGPKWTLNFIPTAEGFYSFTENRYIYQYKDHLGNVRISFARNSAGAPEITGTNNYYPFGLNHIGGGNISPFFNYHSYKFGSKELQETGMYDFGARMYMPDLGRWGVIDPMAEAMRRYSPYNYAFNNPISFIDPDGMQPRQFAMPTDARPDAPSGWINPNWIGRGGATFGSLDTGYGGAGSYGFGSLYKPSKGEGNSYLLNELLAGWKARGLDINIEENGNLTFWTGNPAFIKGYSTNNDIYGEYHLGVLNSITVKNGDLPLDAYKNWADWGSTAMGGGLDYIAKRRTALYNSGYWIDNLGQMRGTSYAGRASGSLIGLRSDYVRTTAMYGKYAKRAGYVGYAISAGQIGYGISQDDWKFGVRAKVATANVAGGMAGAWLGTKAGAAAGGELGALIGVWFEGVGAIPGGAIGGAIGGVIGGILGGVYGGDYAEDWATGVLNKPDHIKK
uniref:RHS repeat-associated core domain-containing protein n=1 Tax=Chryseobacterium indologenes TaxID=253 RepID=UPI00293BE2F6